jgi:O-antigen/teichoic acid export membrane protein
MLQNFKNRIIFGVFSVIGTKIISLTAGLFTMPLFFHYLPRDVLGVWMLFLGADVFINLSDFGLSPVLLRHMAFELGKGDRDGNVNYEGAGYYFSIAKFVGKFSALIIFAILSILGGLFLRSLDLRQEILFQSILALLIFAFSKAILVRYKYTEIMLQGHGEVGWKEWIYSLSVLFALACYFIVLKYLNGNLIEMTIVSCLQSIFIVIGNLIAVETRISHKFRAVLPVAWSDVKPHIKPAFDMFVVSIGTFLILNTDQYFIVKFLGAGALPDYAAAYRMVFTVYLLAVALSMMTVPFISRISAAGDKKNLHRLLLINTSVGMITLLAGMLIIALFGDALMGLWLGKGHFVGWSILWVFCTMLTLEGHHVIFAQVGLNSKTDPSWGKVSIIAGVINLVLTYFGVHMLGLFGVAFATMVTQMMTCNWFAVWKTLKIVGMSIRHYFMKSGIVWLSYTLFTALVLIGIKILSLKTEEAVLVAALASMVVYASALILYARLIKNGFLKYD